MEAYGSLTASSLSRTVDEATDDSAARSERANGLKSFALSLGKAAVCVAIGIVVGRNGDSASASGGASTTSTSLSTASAATAAVETAAAATDAATAVTTVETAAAEETAEVNQMPFTTGMPYTTEFKMDARANAAVSTGARATWSVAATGKLARLPGDNVRWTDEAAAAWTCCASYDEETGSMINNPPFAQPDIITSSNGILETTLKVTEARYEGPISFNTRVYNGGLPGPTFVVKRGDKLKIDLANDLEFPTTAIEVTTNSRARVKKAVRDALGECLPYSEPNVTSLHVHGLHTNVDGIGDYPLKVGHPKETVPYELHVRDDHPTGTFWYHPHTKDAAGLQELGFMHGALIVDDDTAAWDSTGLEGITDRLLMFQWVDFLHDFDNYTFMSKCSGSNMHTDFKKVTAGTDGYRYVTLNAQYLPELDIGTGEYQRWRFVNAISHAFLNISVVDKHGAFGCDMWEIGADGVYYASPRAQNSVFVTLGGRKDVIVQCKVAGSYTLYTYQKENVFSDPNMYGGSLAAVEVYSETRATSIDMTSVTLPSAGLYSNKRSLINSKVSSKQDIILSDWKDAPTEYFTVNGVTYNGLVGNRIALDAVQEWKIMQKYETVDSDLTNHNWHLHTHHFQVTDASVNEVNDYDIGDWRDTINVPKGGWVTVRFKAENYAGFLLHHCHVFNHETAGLKQLVAVVNCSDNEIYNTLAMDAASFGFDISICSDDPDDDGVWATAPTDGAAETTASDDDSRDGRL